MRQGDALTKSGKDVNVMFVDLILKRYMEI